MSAVLIVSKTRMANNKVCVGGIDIDKKNSIRLLDQNGYHESSVDCPYNIWDVWDLGYNPSNQRPLPHTEDVNVYYRMKKGVLKEDFQKAGSLVQLLHKLEIPVFKGSVLNAFDGKLKTTQYGTLYVNDQDVPNYSTCFWIPDRAVNRSVFHEKQRYNYNNGSQNWGYNISYVGLSEPIDIIPKDSLVRLSLAHWWSPDDSNDEERCYLQLSGWVL